MNKAKEKRMKTRNACFIPFLFLCAVCCLNLIKQNKGNKGRVFVLFKFNKHTHSLFNLLCFSFFLTSPRFLSVIV